MWAEYEQPHPQGGQKTKTFVSSESDADQSKCYLNSLLRHHKLLHLESTSTRCYSVLQTKAKLRECGMLFFFFLFSNLLCQQNEKELISGWSMAKKKRAEMACATSIFSPVQLENWRRKSSRHKIIYTLMVRYTLLVIRSPLPGGGNPIMWATSR